VAVAELYAQWKTWCEDNGRKPEQRPDLRRDLRSVVPALRVAQPRDGETRERCYLGLALKRPGDNGSGRVPPRAEPDDATAARNGTRPEPLSPQLFDAWVLAHVIRTPRPVGAIAGDLGADAWDVQAALKRLADRGAVICHPPTTGPPTWSLPPAKDQGDTPNHATPASTTTPAPAEQLRFQGEDVCR